MRMDFRWLGGWMLTLGLLLGGCEEELPVETEYLNLAKEVAYTGKESCKSCHQKIYDSYVETGMGKSFYLPSRDRIIESFGPESVVFDEYSGYSYRPYWSGDDFLIMEFRLDGGDTIHKRIERVDYIVGSGHQTRSYLMDRDGRLFEVPITWYVRKQKWDLSPGYEDGHNTRFDREIGEECMACHTGFIAYDNRTTNLFTKVALGIDCEKCHGPGEVHIERMEQDLIVDVGEEIDYSIVNPGKLPVQKQFDVCQQCHLQGVVVTADGKSVLDYRPGMDLSSVYNIFIEKFDNDEAFGIASHAERLIQSQCFIQSGEDLTCTTCHDPHKSIAVTDSMAYVKQCQSCHTPGKIVCGAPEELQMLESGNCISCHMPKGGTADIPHVQFTDHKIRVVKDTVARNEVRNFLKLVCMTEENPAEDIRAKAYLLYFERVSPKPEYLEIAAKNLAPSSHYAESKTLFFQGKAAEALTEIDQALQQEPDNSWYQFHKGEILESQGKLQEASDLFASIYQKHPQVLEAGEKVGVLALKIQQDPQQALNKAGKIFSELYQKKSWDEKIVTNLGFVEMNSGQFEQALGRFEQAIRLNPEYVLARENQVICLVQMGRKPAARQALSDLLKWIPDYGKAEMMKEMVN